MAERAAARSSGAHRPPALSPPAFVGRAPELAALGRALAGPPAVVLVAGEAGIGKTRLLREFLAAHGDRGFLVAGCPPFRQPYTLGPVVDAIRQATDSVRDLALSPLGGALRSLFPEWVADLPDAPEPAEDGTAARHRLFRALVELLDGLRIESLVVEDVHWADEATLEFLLFLMTRHPQRSSLLLTYRPDDVPAGSLLLRVSSRLPTGTAMLRVTLEPLDVGETEALVTSMLPGAQVSSGFATFLHDRTEGLPLAIEESLRLMYDRADLTQRDGTWVRRRLDDIAVPPTVRDAVLERAARLGPDAQEVLRAAAVLSDPASEATLLVVAGLAEQAGLAEALWCGLLHEDTRGRIAFRHALACRAVQDAIPAPLRRTLHLRAGDALRDTSPPPLIRLARHYRSAGDVANWSAYAERAAAAAMAVGDTVTAATTLHDLVTTAELPIPDLVRLARALPMGLLDLQGRMLSLVAALRSALDRDGLDPTDEAEIRFQLARSLLVMGDYESAKPEFMLAVRQLPRGSADRARAMIFLGLPFGVAQPASVHRRWLHEAEQALAEVSAEVPAEERLQIHLDSTAALLMLGEPRGWQQAARFPVDAASAAERSELVRGDGNFGETAIWWGRYGEARQRLMRCYELAEKYEYHSLRDSTAVTLAHLDWLTGRWDGLAERLAPFAADPDLRSSIKAEATLVLALRSVVMGDTGEAKLRLLARHADGRESGTIDRFAESAAALARLWLADGRVAEGLSLTREPAEIVVTKGLWVCGADIVPARVDLLAAAGRMAEARDLVTAYGELIDGQGAPAADAALACATAMIATDPEDAAALFERAAGALEALPRPHDAWLARERQGGCLLAAGHTDAGRTLLSDVFVGLAELGARAAAERVMATLRQHGVTVRRPWRGGSRGYGDELSPRELDVVRLLVDGRSNREIAEALVLSPKTVARHVDSAMRKLGVNSRTALAVKVVEAGHRRAEG